MTNKRIPDLAAATTPLARPWQKDHCRMAYESEILRLQYTAEFRAVRDIALTIKDH